MYRGSFAEKKWLERDNDHPLPSRVEQYLFSPYDFMTWTGTSPIIIIIIIIFVINFMQGIYDLLTYLLHGAESFLSS